MSRRKADLESLPAFEVVVVDHVTSLFAPFRDGEHERRLEHKRQLPGANELRLKGRRLDKDKLEVQICRKFNSKECMLA